MLDKIIEKADKINYNKLKPYQRSQYFSLKNRIEWLLTLQFFLSLRQKIKKEVTENYSTKTSQQLVDTEFVIYDAYGFIDYKGYTLYNLALQPLIESYVWKQIFEIESNTLKLDLCN